MARRGPGQLCRPTSAGLLGQEREEQPWEAQEERTTRAKATRVDVIQLKETTFRACFSADAGGRCCWNSRPGHQTFQIPKGILQHPETWFPALLLISPVTLGKSLPGAHAVTAHIEQWSSGPTQETETRNTTLHGLQGWSWCKAGLGAECSALTGSIIEHAQGAMPGRASAHMCNAM